MVEFTLRQAGPADLNFVLHLQLQSMRPHIVAQYGTWDYELQRAGMNAETILDHWIIEADNGPVGAMLLIEHSHYLELNRIYLLPAYQGRGFGTNIIQSILAEASMRELRVQLRVLRVSPAKRLYERLGFVVRQIGENHFEMEHPGSSFC